MTYLVLRILVTGMIWVTLDTKMDLDEGATKAELESAMEGHILEKAELVGLYSRG